jgi:deazaflavin-dependent oxidoreductase (nitroreductase family)
MRLPAPVYRVIGRFSVTRFDRRLHPVLYRLTGGRGFLGHILGCEMILVTSTGARTGKRRTVALFAFPDGDRWFVIGSRGGSAQVPGWVRNLAADPHGRIQHRRVSWPVVASVASGGERSRLWSIAAAAYPGFDTYAAQTPHEIPVVVLAPVAAAASTDGPVGPGSAERR